jgi:ribosomal protein S18 acetylase RimI-like enzyme
MGTIILGDKKLTVSQLTVADLKCAKEYADFINSLIAEEAKILMNVKQTLKDEQNWVKEAVQSVKNKKKVFIIVRDGKKIVANTSIEIQAYKRNHIGRFAIAIRDGYRGIGLGTYIMGEIMKLAKKELNPKPKIFQLVVLENNKSAIGLYNKMGFKIITKIPKQVQHGGKLIGEYIMMRNI